MYITKYLSTRMVQNNLASVFILFSIIVFIHILAAITQYIPLTFIGMILYTAFTFVFVNREDRKKIRINKIINTYFLIIGVVIAIICILLSSYIYFLTLGYGSSNYLVFIGRQQLSYEVINKSNEWNYFPIAAIGYTLLSPFTEEFFFRGIMLFAFENKFSQILSNIFQSIFFAFMHMVYFSLLGINLGLISFIPFGIVAGYLYGWVTQKTESVFSAILLHIIINLVIIYIVYLFIIPIIG